MAVTMMRVRDAAETPHNVRALGPSGTVCDGQVILAFATWKGFESHECGAHACTALRWLLH